MAKRKVTKIKEATAVPPRYVVGVGASAGGLEALRTLFGNLRGADRLAFVVVQHLSPQHRSRLVELIAQTTPLRVQEIEEGETPRANTVYVTPPNSDVVLENRALRLKRPGEKVGPKPSVDLFLRSLAAEMGENGIAVILSGTGSDGAQGIRALKAAGGVTIVQSLESAKYDGMPRAAKQTGAADLELPPEEIAKQLSLFNELSRRLDPGTALQDHLPIGPNPYRAILSLLERASKVSFSQYKQSTVRRRIERRMTATRCGSLKEYAEYLQAKPEETRKLFEDILISVTSFFRDDDAFEEARKLVRARLDRKSPETAFRCWVVGCATGEEVYSLAILIREEMEAADKVFPLQIFATDIDERAMTAARKGQYPKKGLRHLPPKLVRKYFEEGPEQCRVKDVLRESVVFARHDVTSDPPFLKLDLVSCRNVLIYFGPKLQEAALRNFHFALDDKGLLFLGRSETASAAADLFELADKNSRLFYRSGKKGGLPLAYSRQERNREALLHDQDRATREPPDLFDSVVAGLAPDSLLVDRELKVLHVYGEASRFLNLPRGRLSSALPKLVPPELSVELGALFHRASRGLCPARGTQRYGLHLGAEPVTVQLQVTPLNQDGSPRFLVSFLKAGGDAHADPGLKGYARLSAAEKVKRLERELGATREHLQTVIEEHETANEEMQALNEEMQSANEELQSTNEELETTNEELQSANEELTTLNDEINIRSTELAALNQRLQAIQGAIYYPLIILDPKLRLVDFNPAARYLLRVGEMDKNLPLSRISCPLRMEEVCRVIETAFASGKDGRLELESDERRFEVRVQLYEGFDRKIEGAVVSFVDHTELVKALEQSRLHQARLSAILENTPALVTMKDATGVYTYVNRRFSEELGIPPQDVLGRTDEEVFGPEAGGRIRDKDFEVLRTRKPAIDQQTIEVDTQARHWLTSRFPLLDYRNKAQSICTISLENTDFIRAKWESEVFRRVVSASNAGIAIFVELGCGFVLQSATDRILGLMKGRDGTRGESLETFLGYLLDGREADRTSALADRLRARNEDSVTLNLEAARDGESWIELKSSLLTIEGGGPRYLILTAFDVTEREKTRRALENHQEEVSKFSKLASLGEIAAGLSHEINTPLNVISTKTDLLRRLADRGSLEPEKVARVSSEISTMVGTISEVVTGLKSVSRMEAQSRQVLNVVPLIQEALRIAEFRLQQSRVKLEVEAPAEPLPVPCYPVQVVQILINLLNNAVDAVCEQDRPWIKVRADRERDRAVIRVVDSGRGIDPAVAEKIMVPFFTTKRDRNGTGLGLSISRNLARSHGGELRVDRQSPNTAFVLELPLGGGEAP